MSKSKTVARLPSERWLRLVFIGATIIVVGSLLLIPLILVLTEAFSAGFDRWFKALAEPDMLSAVKLSIGVAIFVVCVNAAFGVALAWLVTRHRFRWKSLLLSLADLPLSVSPVVSGLVFILVFGRTGLFGPILAESGIKVIFATPGIVLATLFVTLPYVAKELIPLMQTQGDDEEVAATVLGASGWTVFTRITLPKIRWGLLYGIILANARAMGEFGAVSVVSGHIRGLTNTIPLHVEVVYNEYDFVGAFAAASVLTFLALVTLVVKTYVERRARLALEKGSESEMVGELT